MASCHCIALCMKPGTTPHCSMDALGTERHRGPTSADKQAVRCASSRVWQRLIAWELRVDCGATPMNAGCSALWVLSAGRNKLLSGYICAEWIDLIPFLNQPKTVSGPSLEGRSHSVDSIYIPISNRFETDTKRKSRSLRQSLL